jgi:hypothetical protein
MFKSQWRFLNKYIRGYRVILLRASARKLHDFSASASPVPPERALIYDSQFPLATGSSRFGQDSI